MEVDKQFSIKVDTEGLVETNQGFQKLEDVLPAVEKASEDAGKGLAHSNHELREMRVLTHALNQLLPGTGQMLHALARPEMMGMVTLSVGIGVIIKLFKQWNEELQKILDLQSKLSVAVWEAEQQAIDKAEQSQRTYLETMKEISKAQDLRMENLRLELKLLEDLEATEKNKQTAKERALTQAKEDLKTAQARFKEANAAAGLPVIEPTEKATMEQWLAAHGGDRAAAQKRLAQARIAARGMTPEQLEAEAKETPSGEMAAQYLGYAKELRTAQGAVDAANMAWSAHQAILDEAKQKEADLAKAAAEAAAELKRLGGVVDQLTTQVREGRQGMVTAEVKKWPQAINRTIGLAVQGLEHTMQPGGYAQAEEQKALLAIAQYMTQRGATMAQINAFFLSLKNVELNNAGRVRNVEAELNRLRQQGTASFIP